MFTAAVADKKEFNGFVASRNYSQFTQSMEWGKFQESAGNSFLPLVIKKGEDVWGSALVVEKELPQGKCYLYCPRGPIISPSAGEEERKRIMECLLSDLKERYGQQGAIFFRFEPDKRSESDSYKIVESRDIQPSGTILLPLSPAEEDILAVMHPKTRYNIRLSSRKGVKVRRGDERDFESFWELMTKTGERDGFRLHPKEYYKKMIGFDSRFFRLFLAYYNNTPIAGSIVGFFGDTATYIHGASDITHRRLMAPYALQWQAIRTAKEEGLTYYDLYGVDEDKWPGVTRFKRGFGGETVQFPGTFDAIFKPIWYKIYSGVRRIRRRS